MANRFKNGIIGLAAALFSLAATPSYAADNLPTREGPRPETTNSVPHVQIGIEAIPELSEELLQRVSNIPDVKIRDTILSLPGALGFWISDDASLAHPEAIIRGREFAHIHPDGSLHASLKPETARAAVKAGWATPHPWSTQRAGWEGFVMIYTPQSAEELDVVVQLVLESFNYVTGQNVEET